MGVLLHPDKQGRPEEEEEEEEKEMGWRGNNRMTSNFNARNQFGTNILSSEHERSGWWEDGGGGGGDGTDNTRPPTCWSNVVSEESSSSPIAIVIIINITRNYKHMSLTYQDLIDDDDDHNNKILIWNIETTRICAPPLPFPNSRVTQQMMINFISQIHSQKETSIKCTLTRCCC